MADICPVCNKEIKAEDREEYKISSESSPIPIHNFCLDEFVSKPEGYFVKLREELAIEKEKDLVREKGSLLDVSLKMKPLMKANVNRNQYNRLNIIQYN